MMSVASRATRLPSPYPKAALPRVGDYSSKWITSGSTIIQTLAILGPVPTIKLQWIVATSTEVESRSHRLSTVHRSKIRLQSGWNLLWRTNVVSEFRELHIGELA